MDAEHLEAFLSGELDENGRRQVEHALRHDSELRESFLYQARMEAALRVLLGPGAEENEERFQAGIIARLRSEGAGDTRSFAKSVLTEIVEERERQRPVRWPDLVKTGIISAAASIGLLLLLQSVIFRGEVGGDSERPRTRASVFAARIERSESARWASASTSKVRDDGWLSPGLIRLEEGNVLIAFNSGASALVEAPAELSIESGNRLFLRSGRMTAEVPPPASGFTVNTPRFNVVDIGTRFGVSVREDGDSELHVMEGEVEASRTSGNSVPIRVREGLALRADNRTRSALIPVPYEGDRFRLRLGEAAQAPPSLHYSFDESAGAIVEDLGKDRAFDVPLVASGELDRSPRRAPGRSGGGLVFQPGESLQVALSREFRLEDPHTVAFWVKLPPKPGRGVNEDLLEYGREGMSWKISCHFEPGKGTRGGLRVECGGGFVVGGTDIADGNWHHVAYRHIGGKAGDLVSQIHLFVDGRPETISDSRAASVPAGRVGALRFGSDPVRGFQGWIDDLYVYRESVSTNGIQKLGE